MSFCCMCKANTCGKCLPRSLVLLPASLKVIPFKTLSTMQSHLISSLLERIFTVSAYPIDIESYGCLSLTHQT